jgi:spore photoproduct lyase
MIGMVEIQAILIEENLSDCSETKDICSKFPSLSPIIITPDNRDGLLKQYDLKTTLLITKSKGETLGMCPGTNVYLCCNYYVLDLGLNCLYSCDYCILQDYLNTEMQVAYANMEETLSVLEKKLKTMADKQWRIGTGELTDSLILDPITGLSTRLISLFKDYKNVILELKTKSVHIENLLDIPAPNNVVIAWSLNPQFIIDQIERNTPSLEDRIEAAAKVVAHGYDVCFHFDPMILYPDAEADYLKVIDALYEAIPGERIRWISMGSLRFTKGLKDTFVKKSPLFINEFILGDDNKYRYLRKERVRLYKSVLSRMQHYYSDQFVYLCMESEAVWESVLGFALDDNDHFERWFNEAVFK